MRYQVNFRGRRTGSIGTTFRTSAIVSGENEEEARLNLYRDGWEHVSEIAFKPLPEEKQEE